MGAETLTRTAGGPLTTARGGALLDPGAPPDYHDASAIPPAEIVVPRELLRGMLFAQADDVVDLAVMIDDSFAGSLENPWRARDLAVVGKLNAALQVRSALDRAVEDGAAVSLQIVRDNIARGIAYFNDPHADDVEGDRVILNELVAWRDANGLGAVDRRTARRVA